MSARPFGPNSPTVIDVRDAGPIGPAARPDYGLLACDPLDPRGERIRALRTELMLRGGQSARADFVALLSPCTGEGRSILAAELALAFAQTGRSTLLVDSDLRRPRQHDLFGTDNRMGLSQAICTGEPPLLRSVEGFRNMSLLTAGLIPPNPLELLSSDTFGALVERWRRTFEVVVFDTAPMKHYADALAVASHVGRVLALSRAEHTPANELRDMLRRLAVTRSHILGAVINRF